MTRRVVQNFKPFAFQGDFSGQPQDAADDRLALSAPELAALISEARAEGAAEMAARETSGDAARLAEATEKLNAALADLVALAAHLEQAAGPGAADEAKRLINRAASRIIDGQGDLFARDAGP